MTEDQGTELIIILKQIAESLAEIAGSVQMIATDDLSFHDKVSLSVLNGLLSDGDVNVDSDKICEISREIADSFIGGSNG